MGEQRKIAASFDDANLLKLRSQLTPDLSTSACFVAVASYGGGLVRDTARSYVMIMLWTEVAVLLAARLVAPPLRENQARTSHSVQDPTVCLLIQILEQGSHHYSYCSAGREVEWMNQDPQRRH